MVEKLQSCLPFMDSRMLNESPFYFVEVCVPEHVHVNKPDAIYIIVDTAYIHTHMRTCICIS